MKRFNFRLALGACLAFALICLVTTLTFSVGGHNRENPHRGEYAPSAGFSLKHGYTWQGDRITQGDFMCRPDWVATRFFYYPSMGFWKCQCGDIYPSNPAGQDPYTVVVNETAYEQDWHSVLGPFGYWVTNQKKVTYYYTATWCPGENSHGYVNNAGVVVYIR